MYQEPSFHRLAEIELNEAAAYYELERSGLGAHFLREVDRCIESVVEHPLAEDSFLEMCAADWFVDSLTQSCTQ